MWKKSFLNPTRRKKSYLTYLAARVDEGDWSFFCLVDNLDEDFETSFLERDSPDLLEESEGLDLEALMEEFDVPASEVAVLELERDFVLSEGLVALLLRVDSLSVLDLDFCPLDVCKE